MSSACASMVSAILCSSARRLAGSQAAQDLKAALAAAAARSMSSAVPRATLAIEDLSTGEMVSNVALPSTRLPPIEWPMPSDAQLCQQRLEPAEVAGEALVSVLAHQRSRNAIARLLVSFPAVFVHAKRLRRWADRHHGASARADRHSGFIHADRHHLPRLQPKQNADGSVGEHGHRFDVRCCGAHDAAPDRAHGFHSVPHRDMVLLDP